ncbi:hypothetical protein GTS_16060 [Gandjariella thermophila]|uniref:Lipoprotein n=2 Tax=Gandjariella thermophila TaxID=1931992 RepID=A0A4D4J7X4_9PSEU|nr:hypothetical protein GTS_16060 [Gandjariella thermophila]
MRPVWLAGVALLVLLAGCAGGSRSGTPAPPTTADATALRVKVHALEADQCQRVDARTVYPECGRYVTEVAGTVGTLRSQLSGQPAAGDALARLQSGVSAYQSRGCDGPAAPADECAAALTTLRTALAQAGSALPGG